MASLKLELLDTDNEKIWDHYLHGSGQGSVYHSLDWLKLLESYSDSELHLFTAKKGEQCVGLFPLFTRRRFGIITLFSPPPTLAVPYLGPAFPANSTKRSEVESIAIGFLDLVLGYIGSHLNIHPSYSLIHTDPQLVDMRPFSWRGFNVQPLYSYIIGIEPGLDNIRRGFSQSERRYLKRVEKDEDIKVEIGDQQDLVLINDLVKARYNEQGMSYSVPNQYLLDLYEKFPQNIFSTKLIHEGKTVSGMIYVKNNDTLSFWIGGTPPIQRIPGGITLLHWWGMEKAMELELEYYEVMGANTEHLSRYKSKLNPELLTYYAISKKNLQGRFAEFLYKRFRKAKRV